MDETLRQLGELLLGSVPTVILLALLYLLYTTIVHKPLQRVLAELQQLSFPRSRPSLQVKFTGDVAQLENARVEATLRGELVRRGKYEMRDLFGTAEWSNQQLNITQIEWKDGAQLPYLGQSISVMLGAAPGATGKSATRPHFDTDAGVLWLGLPALPEVQQIRERVQGWLHAQALQVFGERLPVYAVKLGVEFRAYALSSAATRWGSCSSDGKIRLNWRLIHFPVPIIDYVVAHELAHLCEMNHSPRFWKTVESIFPDFREARHTLKHHPPELLPLL